MMKSFLLVLATLICSATASSAQFVELLSDEALSEAAAVAADSLGAPAVLVALSAPGPIDLTELGIPVESDGLDFETGRSSVWGYVFRREDSTDHIGVIILKDESGAPMIMTSRDLAFEVEENERMLTLDAAYSRSDAMVDLLRAAPDFLAYIDEYPTYELRETVLGWVSEHPVLVPQSFPIDAPIWQVELMDGETDDDDMTCFIATATGEIFCRRASSGVENQEIVTGSLTATPNVARIGEEIAVRVTTTSMPERIALLDVTGAVVLDLSSRIGAMGPGGPNEFPLSTDALPSGTYYLYVAHDGTMSMAEIRVTR